MIKENKVGIKENKEGIKEKRKGEKPIPNDLQNYVNETVECRA